MSIIFSMISGVILVLLRVFCKWLMEYKWLADKHEVNIRGVYKLANEVEPRVGEHLERWKKLET
ncbi:hypothetical protein ES703_26857 [subsurface metagenome]